MILAHDIQVEPRNRAAPELLGPKGRDVDKEEAIRYRRRRLDDFLGLDHVLLLDVAAHGALRAQGH